MNCFLFTFIGLAASAQFKPAQLLNDVRTFEVSASKPSKNEIIAVWVEKRPQRKDNSDEAADLRVAYKSSTDNGKTWSEKKIIDNPDNFGIGNPYIISNNNQKTYLVCMHIGKDFWSGNLSLYEFDSKSRQFNLKSVPIESSDNLLDKPAIAVVDDQLHLVYVAYPKGKKNTLRYQMSSDNGKTWTTPIDVFDKTGGSFLGPSIAITSNKEIIVSSGAYGSKDIQIAKKTASQNAFQDPVTVTKVTPELGAAMTELNRFEDKLLLTWQNPHQRNQTWLSYSQNDGNTWTKPSLITSYGNLLSAVFDKQGFLHCIYSDFSDSKYTVGYKKMDKELNVLKQSNLQEKVPCETFSEYLGAFQKLLIYDQELFAFWIDYPGENSLYFSKWKI